MALVWIMLLVTLLYFTTLAKEEIFESKCKLRRAKEAPKCPHGIYQISPFAVDSATVNWSAPEAGTRPIQQYVIVIKNRTTRWRVYPVRPSPWSSGINIVNLTVDQDYWIKVLAISRHGLSKNCPKFFIGTTPKNYTCGWLSFCRAGRIAIGSIKLPFQGAKVGMAVTGWGALNSKILLLKIVNQYNNESVKLTSDVHLASPDDNNYNVTYECFARGKPQRNPCYIGRIYRKNEGESDIRLYPNIDYELDEAEGRITLFKVVKGNYTATFRFGFTYWNSDVTILVVHRGVVGLGTAKQWTYLDRR